MYAYNITQKIKDYADKLELGCLSTGGGVDFVHRKLTADDTPGMKLCGLDESPESLDEESIVWMYFNEDETDGTAWAFCTAREAMDFMASRFSVGKVTVRKDKHDSQPPTADGHLPRGLMDKTFISVEHDSIQDKEFNMVIYCEDQSFMVNSIDFNFAVAGLEVKCEKHYL